MSPRRGEFALVYFPHSDLRTVKLRPVLVIQAEDLDTGLPQVIVAMSAVIWHVPNIPVASPSC